jgi:hypothetical protein
MHIDPDVGIPDLVHRLADDSKRLVKDEIRLGKLELADDVRRAGHGSLWLVASFGVGVLAMVSLTIMLIALVGRLSAGHMWAGALLIGAIEVVAGMMLVKRGKGAFGEPSYSLEQTREGLADIMG